MLCHLRLPIRHLQQRLMPTMMQKLAQRGYAQKVTPPPGSEETISNEPIQFFGSDAAKWRAKDTRSGGADEVLSYQPYVISGSLAIFLLYFCVLREENDIDRKLEGNLFDHVHGLEEIQLTVNYKYNKEHGLDTKELEARLTELGIDVRELETQRLATQ